MILLFQSGAPSQIDLFDPQPQLHRQHGDEIPDSVRTGQRLAGMTSDQQSKPLTASLFEIQKHGTCGADVSELLPYTTRVVDHPCFIRSLHTEAIHHDPAITFMQTGTEQPGRPSMGAWLSYGLGHENAQLPTFVVFISGGSPGDQPLCDRLWGSGFLPSQHQGVRFRGGGDPVLYLKNPPGISRQTRRRMLDGLAALHCLEYEAFGDPQILARIAQYEMAYRMQASVPKLRDVSREPQHVLALYGEDVKTPGTFAANCLLARRLVEQGVRFVQLDHRDWDHHDNLPARIRDRCKQTD